MELIEKNEIMSYINGTLVILCCIVFCCSLLVPPILKGIELNVLSKARNEGTQD